MINYEGGREEVARGMARRDGHDFERLDGVMQSAYLHNADLHISLRPKPPEPSVEEIKIPRPLDDEMPELKAISVPKKRKRKP